MTTLWARFRNDWPSWLAVAFIALLPVGRASEVPLSLFAIALPILALRAEHRERLRAVLPFIATLFACYWLPMVFSALDSYDPAKSWYQSLVALRFPAAALSMAVLLQPEPQRWRVLKWASIILFVWAVDGFIQLVLGVDIFGVPMAPGHLNALFASKAEFYGPMLAMLSPLMLEFTRRRWPPWAWTAVFAFTLGAVMFAGMRSGWVAMGLVTLAYLVMMLRQENRQLRIATLAIPVVAVVVAGAAWFSSPTVQERVERTMSITQSSSAAVNHALSWRMPVYVASVNMFVAHPVNGVGVRAFPAAFPKFVEPVGGDDIPDTRRDPPGATHAHNLVLEVMADTGSIGLLGLVLGLFFALRSWLGSSPVTRLDAFPYVLSLALILFPLNVHFAIFGSYISAVIWFLLGLWAATLPGDARKDS